MEGVRDVTHLAPLLLLTLLLALFWNVEVVWVIYIQKNFSINQNNNNNNLPEARDASCCVSSPPFSLPLLPRRCHASPLA